MKEYALPPAVMERHARWTRREVACRQRLGSATQLMSSSCVGCRRRPDSCYRDHDDRDEACAISAGASSIAACSTAAKGVRSAFGRVDCGLQSHAGQPVIDLPFTEARTEMHTVSAPRKLGERPSMLGKIYNCEESVSEPRALFLTFNSIAVMSPGLSSCPLACLP